MRPPPPPERRLLGGLSPGQFLRRCWQKRPHLVRGALEGFRDPLGPDDLAGLACSPDVESRLVLVRGGSRPFQVVPGPQDPRRLRRLPATRWTLLVQGVDRHVASLARLRERFRFVPDWRIDDVMVSFAPRGGTVGPHVDGYDVFLVQGRGRRRWGLQRRPDPALRRGLDLRVLRRFRADVEWVLEPGDMLYVPPGTAHHGVALEDCLTYSIGFRAPSHREILAGVLSRLLRGLPPDRLYADPDLVPTREPGEITPRALERLHGIVALELGRLGGRDLDRCLGELLTEPRDGDSSPRSRPLTAAVVRRRLASGAALVRAPGSRMAFVRRRPGADLFVDGRLVRLGPRLAFAAPLLTGGTRLGPPDLAPHRRVPGFAALVAELVNTGALALRRR